MSQWTTNFADARGRVTNVTDALSVRLHTLDPNNNLLSIVEKGKTVSWTFDAYDRVSTYLDSDGNLIQYHWDANGNLTNLVYPGGKNVYYAFDSLNRLTNVTDWAGRQTRITWDLANRVTSITRPNGTIRIINYDADGEATNIVEKTLSNFPIAFFTLGWTNPGRVAWEFAAPLPHTNAPPVRTMTYNDDNQLATFKGPTMGSAQNVTMDLDGNMTWGPGTNDTFNTYAYNARNWLLAMGSCQYGYDPSGSRTSVTNGGSAVHYVINPNAKLPQVLIRTKADGTQTFYVYGLGLLYEVNFDANGTELNTRTYHYDLRGSTVALTDSTGLPSDLIQYSIYGLTTYRAGTTDTPFLYNGRYGVMTDPNGLLYMRARYYNPYICRFINPDPSGLAGGLNFYCYADGNPVSNLDPFGLFSWGRIAQGSGEVLVGVVAAVVVGAWELPSAGTVTIAVPTIFLGITHGMTTIGVGLQSAPTSPQQQEFLETYPSNPGQLVGLSGYAFSPSVGRTTETTAGLLWEVSTVGSSTFGALNSFVEAERLGLPLTELGLDSQRLFWSEVETMQMFPGTFSPGLGNTLPGQDSSTGKSP